MPLRLVTQNMTERELSGQLQRYRVDVWPGSNGLRRNRTECESLATECHVQLDSGNYTISVSVENGAGWGQEKGWISIPSAGRIGKKPNGLGQFYNGTSGAGPTFRRGPLEPKLFFKCTYRHKFR